jgi:hypothetical protein
MALKDLIKVKNTEVDSSKPGEVKVKLQILSSIDDTLSKSITLLTMALNKSNKLNSADLKSKDKDRSMSNKEEAIEQLKIDEKMLKFMEGIFNNTLTSKPKKADDWGLGAIGSALALAFGALVGAVQGYTKAVVLSLKIAIKSIKSIGTLIAKVFTGLAPTWAALIKKSMQNFAKGIASRLAGLSMQFDLVVDSIKTYFKKLGSKVKIELPKPILDFMKTVSSKVSAAVKVVSAAVKAVFTFLQPITNLAASLGKISIAPIVGVVEKIANFFKSMFGYMSKFGALASKILPLVSKLFLPLTIVITAFESIKAAIQGYADGGILGALEGGISAFFKVLVGAPLDLLKDMISWVLDKFGLESASDMLDSFSFSDIISKYFKAIFHPIETLKNIFTDVMNALAKIQIGPFKILGKQFGPYKPFSGLAIESPSETSDGGSLSETSDGDTTEKLQPSESTTGTYSQVEKTQLNNATPEESDRIRDLIKGRDNNSGNTLDKASAEVEMLKTSPPPPSNNNNIVNAPTNINAATNNNFPKAQPRNGESSINKYFNSKYSWT